MEACAVYPWLDELLWDIGLLSTDTLAGPMAAEAVAYVLLETVAICQDKSA